MERKYPYPYPFQNLSLADMEGEIWKDMFEFEGYLMISNYGRIKALPKEIVRVIKGYICRHTTKVHIRKQSLTSIKRKINNRTYNQLNIGFTVESRQYNIKVARAVYSTFVKPLRRNIDTNTLVCHKDDNSLNCRVENLFELDIKYINKRSIALGKNIPPRLDKQGIKELVERRRKPVSQYDRNGNFINFYESIAEASRQTGIDKALIGHVCLGNIKQAAGFIWQAGNNREKLSKEIMHKHYVPKFNNGEIFVGQYDKKGNFIRHFNSLTEASESTGIRLSSISQASSGKGFTAGGYIWKRETKEEEYMSFI